jgi:hypothetical protein
MTLQDILEKLTVTLACEGLLTATETSILLDAISELKE